MGYVADMLIRLLALCLMIAFAIPATEHPCADGGPTAEMSSSMASSPDAGCHKPGDSKAVHHGDSCGCAMHQAGSAPALMADAGVPVLPVLVRHGPGVERVLRGLASTPLSPPPDPRVS